MKFHEYRSGWELVREVARDRGFHNDGELAEWMLRTGQFGDPITFRHAVFTAGWRRLGSPYYDVYTGIIPALLKCSLDFPGTMVHRPSGLEHLYLRFPRDRGHALRDERAGIEVRGLFLSFQKVTRGPGTGILEQGLVVGIDVGEESHGIPIFTMKIFPLDERNVEQSMDVLPDHDSLGYGLRVDRSLFDKCVRLSIAICMIQDDPDILEPQVLSRDEGRESDLETLVDRARRRGKHGWSLGRSIEMVPHIRRPHPALVWTGKGRTVPKIVFRKGSIVHREVVEKIPTSFQKEA